tara:strand:+ start:1120 stop:1266 length:147 start_codon:yes stop_codon:yes gene_type:complete
MSFLDMIAVSILFYVLLQKYGEYKTQKQIDREKEDDLYLARLFNVLEE